MGIESALWNLAGTILAMPEVRDGIRGIIRGWIEEEKAIDEVRHRRNCCSCGCGGYSPPLDEEGNIVKKKGVKRQ